MYIHLHTFTLKRITLLLVAAGLLVGLWALLGTGRSAQAVPAASAASYFLKIDGIEGESTDAKHKNEIDLLSYGWSKDKPGLEQILGQGEGTGAGSGKVSLQDIHFSSRVSKASPLLMLHTAQGKHIKEAILTVRKAGKEQQDYFKVKMTDVLVSSYQTTADNGQTPTDQFSLNFAKIEFEYLPQQPDGTLGTPIKSSWNFKLNEAL